MNCSQIYLNYDQEALVLYANIGIVRRARKDIEANKVQLIEENETYILFNADGQEVTLPAKGILNASCSCSARSHCKHIISAILWLQSQTWHLDNESNTEKQNGKQGDQLVTVSSDAISELLSLDENKLLKSVGKANIRLAYQLATQWQEHNSVTIEDQGSQIRIRVPESTDPIIYMFGTGFAGMLSQLPDQQKKAVHLAIIAYLFRLYNKPWIWSNEIINENPAIDRLSSDEIILIEQIDGYIYSLINQGLAHVSHSIAIQLNLLNMSARSQGLPRLAAMLRHLCQIVEQLADRHFSTDELDLLLFLARLKVYLEMLLHQQGDALSKLRGNSKRQYQTDNQTMNLLPLGGYWWQNKTGALGATFYFWDIDQQQYRQTTLARSYKYDADFNSQTIWNSVSIWQSPPILLMKKAIKLHNPRLSEDNKLASNGSTITLQEEGWGKDEYNIFKSKIGFESWQVLSNYLQNSYQNELVTDNILFIHIHHSHDHYLDEIQQTLVWSVADRQGNLLFLRVFWDEYQNQRIDVLSSFLESKHKPLTVLVYCRKNDDALELEPFALLYEEFKTGNLNTLSLDFEDSWSKGHKGLHIRFKSLKNYLTLKKKLVKTNYIYQSLSTLLIQPILSILENVASMGRTTLLIDEKQQLIQLKNDCDTLGFTLLSSVLNKLIIQSPIEVIHILQAVYLCYLIRESQYNLPIQLK